MLAMHLTKTKVAGSHLPSSLPDHIRTAVVQAMNTPLAPPQQHQSHQRRQSGWAIDPAEKSKYDSIFKTWDPSNTGYIDGERARYRRTFLLI
jgi:hypothetical protein